MCGAAATLTPARVSPDISFPQRNTADDGKSSAPTTPKPGAFGSRAHFTASGTTCGPKSRRASTTMGWLLIRTSAGIAAGSSNAIT